MFAQVVTPLDILQALAALVVAAVAVASLEEWKKQKRYDRVVDAAADVMHCATELNEAFMTARNPMTRHAGTDPDAMEAAFRKDKIEYVNEAISAWNEFMEAVARLELWEPDFRKDDINKLKSAVFDLNLLLPEYYRFEAENKRAGDPELGKLIQEWRAKLWGTPTDTVGKEFAEAVKRVQESCRELVR